LLLNQQNGDDTPRDVATTVLFLPINRDFNVPFFKQWEWNTHYNTHSLRLDFYTYWGMNCVQKLGTACNYLQFRGTHVTKRHLKWPINSCTENENNEDTNPMLFLTFRFSLFTSHNSNCNLFPASQLLLQWDRPATQCMVSCQFQTVKKVLFKRRTLRTFIYKHFFSCRLSIILSLIISTQRTLMFLMEDTETSYFP